jgi:hypothetical protein
VNGWFLSHHTGLLRVRFRNELLAAAIAAEIDGIPVEESASLGGFVNRHAANGIDGHMDFFRFRQSPNGAPSP